MLKLGAEAVIVEPDGRGTPDDSLGERNRHGILVFKAKLADLGTAAAPPEKAREALRALLRSEIDKWTSIIKKAGV